jgi:serine/threonine protein kinase/Tfp pilus assembly protein PilF
MAPIDQSRIWEEAASPPNSTLVRRYRSDWRQRHASPPDPSSYLPDDPARRPAALLALLRADLAIRREAGELARVERYIGRFPDLPADVLVALVYEEYCVREEAGDVPDPHEYDARFPAIAREVRDLIDIHEFVDSSQDLLFGEEPGQERAPFPKAGETIGGFRLVRELGRGGMARVFLALERHLADRPVALKVSRVGSREPQTLALLQHTHIVPIYSYGVDVVTSLHLLCMPYFGSVTLADVLAAPRIGSAQTGSALLAALDELGQPDATRPRSEGRDALSGRAFAQAIAWWGARLAEALQYAHDCGVLHHDIKPSNVLITNDATPMLLDFNLARPSQPFGQRFADLGGTLAYMAPEHIAAVAELEDDTLWHFADVDGRADIYSLGVVLREALGFHPTWSPGEDTAADDRLRALIVARRMSAPRLAMSKGRRKIPAALIVVITRCLQPNPANRYARAAELAADLQSIADDAPLCFTREPEPSRTFRRLWTNRHLLATAFAALALFAALFTAHNAVLRREVMARRDLDAGIRAAAAGEFTAAAAQFAMAFDRANVGATQALRSLAEEADRCKNDALAAGRVRDRAEAFFRKIEPIRFRLITGHGLKSASHELQDVFNEFKVLGPALWTDDPELARLDPARRARLIEEVNEVLFLWVVASDPPGDPQQARRAAAVCERALLFAEPKDPWHALKARYDGRGSVTEGVPARPLAEASARACFEWGLLAVLEGHPELALAWFERAVSLRPDRFWNQFALAFYHALYGDAGQALAHYDAAVALRPESSWALFNRAQLAWSRQGDWERALLDLERVQAQPNGLDPELLALELGRVAQRLGDYPSALARYDAVIAANADVDLTRHARLNRARVELELGPSGRARAWVDYQRLLSEDSEDAAARMGHALLALRASRPDVAEADLTRLLIQPRGEPPNASLRAEWLSARALARLALGRITAAASDADEAVQLAPSPGRLRVQLRVAVAARRDSALAALDPDELDRLPVGGCALVADLDATAEGLRRCAEKERAGLPGPDELAATMSRAALLSAIGNQAGALAEADRAVALRPSVADVWLLRARVRRRAGDPKGAMSDVESGLARAPSEMSLQTIRGRLLIEAGRPAAALAILDQTLAAGTGEPAHAVRAQALSDLARYQESIAEWTLALRHDPEDPDAFIGRAGCFVRLGRWEPALADLESAVDCSYDRPAILARAAVVYASCLPERPNRLSRVLGLAWRALLAQVHR